MKRGALRPIGMVAGINGRRAPYKHLAIGAILLKLLGCGSGGEGGAPSETQGGTGGGGGQLGKGGSAGSGGALASGGSGGAASAGSNQGGGGGTIGAPACDAAQPFGTPVLFGPGSGARLTSDELTIVYALDESVVVARRASVDEAFGAPVVLPLDADTPRAPILSDDELILVFEELDDGVMVALRSNTALDFGPPDFLVVGAGDPYLFGGANGRLYAAENGELNLYSITDWNADLLMPLGISGGRPVLTLDELTLYYYDDSAGTRADIRVAQRTSTSESFGPGELAGVSAQSQGFHYPSWISPDDCRLYFEHWGGGNSEIYVAEKPR